MAIGLLPSCSLEKTLGFAVSYDIALEKTPGHYVLVTNKFKSIFQLATTLEFIVHCNTALG